jgi:hypothetical protein
MGNITIIIKREADLLLYRQGLHAVLEVYGQPFIAGSYAYDLMTWRDLDIYFAGDFDLEKFFNLGYKITALLKAYKSFFTDNRGYSPDGLYWGIRLGDIHEGAWKIDIWHFSEQDYQDQVRNCDMIKNRLTADTRNAIIEIKSHFCMKPGYRDTITSDDIYKAVFEHGVRNVKQFLQYHQIKQNFYKR